MEQLISNEIITYNPFADIDGDGDLDLMSASVGDDKIAWYENDGSQNFTEHEVSTSADGAITVFAVDVDGDGDIDILSASYFDNKIAWYENDGASSPGFTKRIICGTNMVGAHGLVTGDIDGDSDIDIIAGGWAIIDNSNTGVIVLCRNDGGFRSRAGITKVIWRLIVIKGEGRGEAGDPTAAENQKCAYWKSHCLPIR